MEEQFILTDEVADTEILALLAEFDQDLSAQYT